MIRLDYFISLLSAIGVTVALCGCVPSISMPKTPSLESASMAPGAAAKHEPNEFEVSTQKVGRRTITVSRHATGQIQPEVGREIMLFSRVAGRIIDIKAKPGQKVSKGEAIATIDSEELSQIEAELIEAKAARDLANSQEEREKQVFEEYCRRPKSLIEARALLDECVVQKELAEREFKRQEEMLKERISAAKDYYIAKARLASIKADFTQKQAAVEREESLFKNKALMKRDYLLAQTEAKKRQKHLDTLKQRLLFLGMTDKDINKIVSSEKISGIINLRSAIDGVVSRRDVDIGEIVDRNKAGFIITDLSRVSVIADIPEVELRHIKTGEKIVIHTASFPDETFKGEISYIGLAINPQSRTVPIKAIIANPTLKLKTNMFAEIDLFDKINAALSCPNSAIQESNGHKVVYVVTKDGYAERQVKLGVTDDCYTQVLDGLKEGDRVVTSDSLLIKTKFANAG